MVKIHINFTNKWLYTFALIIGIFALGVGVYASSHPNPGHTAAELEGVCLSDGTNCLSGGGSLWNLDGSDIYYDAGNIRLKGTTMWFQTDGARTSLCYDALGCALSENTCSEDNNLDFPLEPGDTCLTDVNNAYCNADCTGAVACAGTEVVGCIGSTYALYNFGNLVSCTDGPPGTVTCRCTVNGQKYFSEYLQSPTCIG